MSSLMSSPSCCGLRCKNHHLITSFQTNFNSRAVFLACDAGFSLPLHQHHAFPFLFGGIFDIRWRLFVGKSTNGVPRTSHLQVAFGAMGRESVSRQMERICGANERGTTANSKSAECKERRIRCSRSIHEWDHEEMEPNRWGGARLLFEKRMIEMLWTSIYLVF
jgi:hypothetical protein